MRCTLCLCLVIRALKESPRNRKKQENIKHSGNTTFDEIVNIGTAQSVGCKVDGCHPHDIMDDISSDAVERSAH
ncbi:hypothetical protein A6R68_11686 [Neotoma lepida]|uniref:60S ribosomal protein L12 n=1 Tax=Neotoma lepida TaxID=56216 RepID=A0A1A6FTB2_NEOLE|nr:hypothetical protein A6R68_11686 [Neotoma lepida]